MRTVSNIHPNTWVYNSVLSACTISTSTSATQLLQTALELMERMEEDAIAGHDTAPDTVTYNTLLSVIGHFLDSKETTTTCKDDDNNHHEMDFLCEFIRNRQWDTKTDCISLFNDNREELIYNFLNEMKKKDIPRDSITYRNALMACGGGGDGVISRLLKYAFHENSSFSASNNKGKVFLINAALSVCVAKHNGDMKLTAQLFNLFKLQEGIQSDTVSMKHLIKALGVSGNCEDSMLALNAMKGDAVANTQFLEKYGIDIFGSMDNDEQMIDEVHYSTAINICLRHDELFLALKILKGMKLHGLVANDASLQGIVLAYCKLAKDAARQEFKEARQQQKEKKEKEEKHQG